MTFTRITISPQQLDGPPGIRGLRISVARVVSMVAAGMSDEQILEEHPTLEREDIREVLRYAAESVHLHSNLHI